MKQDKTAVVNGRGIGKHMIGLIVYVLMSATALTLIKIGLGKGSTLLLDKNGFDLNLSWVLLLGALMYVVSFLLSMIVMKGMKLSLFYPLSAGLIYVVVCVLSLMVLKEKPSFSQLVGMALILGGIITMNLGRTN